MEITVIIGVAMVIFIAGVVLVAQGLLSEEQKVVPISSPEEIAELKNAFTPAAPKPPASTLSIPPVIVQAGSTLEPKWPGLDQMKSENNDLKRLLAEQREKSARMEGELESLRKGYESTRSSGSENLKALEQKVAEIQLEKERLLAGKELLDELKSKNEVLRRQYDEHQRQFAEMRAIISRLESEKNDLLKMQREGIDRSELNVLSDRLAGSIAALEIVKGENRDLKVSNQRLEEAFKSIESLNGQLVEKEKKMQYELAKNRAQAFGLERICEDFRTQIESMSSRLAVS